MSMLLEIHPEPRLLRVVATGAFSLGEGKRTFLQMIEAVHLHKREKVLFDGRTVIGNPTTMERFYYGEFAAYTVADLAAAGFSQTTQFAYLLHEPVCDPARFGETVAVNRGMRVKAFDNPDDALGWLGIAPTANSDAGDGK